LRVIIAAVGRLKAGPERELFQRYIDRANDVGRRLGLSFEVKEIPESRAGSATARIAQEGEALTATFGNAVTIALDEGGTPLDSTGLAGRLAKWRENGRERVAFVIGGADGLAESLQKGADLRLAFGRATWPHQLVRVMLAEQVYRAMTILTGHPYHRQ
jgi:23S rRNA (pseudouridine1915-N3)-methyltransferase